MSEDREISVTGIANLDRYWRYVCAGGVLGTYYFSVCVLGAPYTKYMTELGAKPFDFGLLAALGSFALVFQMVAAVWSNHMPRRKRVWMVICIVHRLLFFLVLAAPVLFRSERPRLWWIITVLLVHNILMQFSVPLWMSWMADIIPKDSLNRYWGNRQRIISAYSILTQLGSALLFWYFERNDEIILGFTVLSVTAIIAGVIDILLFYPIPEPPEELHSTIGFMATLKEPLNNNEYRPFLIFRGFFTFAMMFMGPFCYPYMIEELGFSAVKVQLIFLTYAVASLYSSRLCGLLCDIYGFKPVLQMVVVGKCVIPLVYVFLPNIPVFAEAVFTVALLLDGLFQGAWLMIIQGVAMKCTPRKNRAMYIAATNFLAIGLAGGIAPLISGIIIDPISSVFTVDFGPYRWNGYHVIFFAALLLRFSALPLVKRWPEPGSVSVRTVLSYLRSGNPFRASIEIDKLRLAKDANRRARAARRLGRMQSPLAIHELVRSLKDPSRRVRHNAAEALGKIGSAQACEALGRALYDRDSLVQARAARALGDIGGFDSLRALLENLRRLDHSRLGDTISALAKIGDPAAILPLIGLFNDVTDENLRRRIIAALSELCPEDSIEEIAARLLPDRWARRRSQ